MSWDTRDFERGLEVALGKYEQDIQAELARAGDQALAEMVGTVEHETGKTKSSIKVETGKTAEGPYVEWTAGGASVALEFGTSDQKAEPFFRRPIINKARDLTS